MTYQEIMDTTWGEMIDLINCLAIYGGAKEKEPKKSWAEIMRMK